MMAGTAGAVGVAPAKAAVTAAGWLAGATAASPSEMTAPGASSAVWTGAMPEDCGSTETVSGSGTVKPASLPATVAVSVRDGAVFICEVEVQPLMPAAATITPMAIRVCFAGKPRSKSGLSGR